MPSVTEDTREAQYSINHRYEVGFDDILYDTYSRKEDAFRAAKALANQTDTSATVYDRLARSTRPCVWTVSHTGETSILEYKREGKEDQPCKDEE